jgi:hypothetical protein
VPQGGETPLELTWLYIEANPAQWETDNENPAKH